MTAVKPSLELLCVNSMRALSIDAIEKANSGHPGLPLGAAPMAFALWHHHLRFDGKDPHWFDRDRFVLSAGHGSMLLYSLLHLYGFDLTKDDLRAFRQWGSRTPGHPEVHHTAGVEATTGPLGQGTANAVGMAIAERALAHRFNRPGHDLVDHHTYALVSDGDLMEGISSEAAALAGHLRLGKLIYLYDSNDVSLDGPLDLSCTEDMGKRYAAQGWQVLRVEDGDEGIAAIAAAIAEAKADSTRPSLIEVKTTIGFGSPNKCGKAAAHGAPLGAEEVVLTKQALGWNVGEFEVPEAVRSEFQRRAEQASLESAQWRKAFEAYRAEFPELAVELDTAINGWLPDGLLEALPPFETGTKIATRAAGGKVLGALAGKVQTLLGGDADLGSSTKTMLPDSGVFEGQTGAGRNIKFGVREHAMASAANGMALHGGVRPFTATFFCFADYMRPAIRLAALSELPVTFVFTHDSIGVGEDGPTHQPIEHLMSLRVIPNLCVVRPADANETRHAWLLALERRHGPTVLVLSRQGLPVLDGTDRGDGVSRGAYVLKDAPGGPPDLILIGTGSELHLCVEAAELLAAEGHAARVVSMPCREVFEAQDAAYRQAVLPAAVTVRVSVEAGATFGWERYVGSGGASIGIDRFGASAPGSVNFEQFGFTSAHVAAKARELLGARAR